MDLKGFWDLCPLVGWSSMCLLYIHSVFLLYKHCMQLCLVHCVIVCFSRREVVHLISRVVPGRFMWSFWSYIFIVSHSVVVILHQEVADCQDKTRLSPLTHVVAYCAAGSTTSTRTVTTRYWYCPHSMQRAGFMKWYGVHLSAANALLQVCCCGPGGQEISNSCCSSGM